MLEAVTKEADEGEGGKGLGYSYVGCLDDRMVFTLNHEKGKKGLKSTYILKYMFLVGRSSSGSITLYIIQYLYIYMYQ